MAVFTRISQRRQCRAAAQPACGITDGMSAIIMRALAKAPEDRYQRVEELQAALIEQLGGLGQSSVEICSTPRSSKRSMQMRSRARTRHRRCIAHRNGTHARAPAGGHATKWKAFKRKLARQRWLGTGLIVLIAAGFLYGGVRFYSVQRHCRRSTASNASRTTRSMNRSTCRSASRSRGRSASESTRSTGIGTFYGRGAPRCPNPFHRLESGFRTCRCACGLSKRPAEPDGEAVRRTPRRGVVGASLPRGT